MLFGVAVSGAYASTGHADDAGAGDAKTLFEKGRDLRAHNDCAGALPFFQKAYALYPLGLGSLRNIAVCEETLAHYASSRDAWLELKRAVTGNADPKYVGWSEDADRAVTKLAPKVAHLVVDLMVLSPEGAPLPSDGVDVLIDGQPLAKDRVGVAVDHDPGMFTVQAAGGGIDDPDQQAVILAAGESKHVVLRVRVTPAPAAPAAGAPAPVAETAESEGEAPRSSPLRTGAWVSLGVGAAGLAGAAASFVIRQTALGDLKTNCMHYSSSPCNAGLEGTVNRGRTASTLLTVFGAVGIVGAVAGVTLFAVSKPHEAQTSVVLSPTGVSAVGTF
jgi:hypothetical protein